MTCQLSSFVKVFLVLFFSVGVTAEPIFFNGRGKEINSRKRHLFSHRPPYRPGPPNRGPPHHCMPIPPPKTKYITKTSTTKIFETIFETEFFPKTVFDTRLKQTKTVEPPTVTSTTTSTKINTKIEPVYITKIELEPTSITTTITHVVYDTRHLLSSLFQTRVQPQVFTQTVIKDVYHTDIETITNVKTKTMTRTETVRNSDCSTVSGGPFSSGSPLDPRSKFNKDPFSPPYLSSAYSNDAFNDISHSNSEPLKTFTEPLPQPSFDHSDHQFGMSFLGGGNYFRPLSPFNSVYHPSSIGSSAYPYHSFDNKLFDLYGASNPNSFRNSDTPKASSYSQSVKSFDHSSEDSYQDDIDTYSPITPVDIKFQPSRPDPTSISDILDADESYSEEEKPYSFRKPKRLYGEENDPYGIHSAYDSEEQQGTTPDIQEGAVYITDYSDHGGDIHIKEIMKGVKGGEIYEEIHNHGLIAPTYPVHDQPNYPSSYHQNSYPNDYLSDIPIYNYDASEESEYDHYSDLGSSRTRLTALLKQSLNLDDEDKMVYPLVPKEIEYSGHTKSNPTDGYDNSRLPKPDYYRRSSVKAQPKRTLFRSEFLSGKTDRNGRYLGGRRGFGNQGAYSTPVVINLNGSHVHDLYSNTSSNTFTPSKLVDIGIERIYINDGYSKELSLHEQPSRINDLQQFRGRKKFEFNSRYIPKVPDVLPEVVKGLEVAKDENDWVPLDRKNDSNKQIQFKFPQSHRTR